MASSNESVPQDADLESGPTVALETKVYNTLRFIAHGAMRNERRDHVLQTTALVHEAFIRLRREDGKLTTQETGGNALYFAAARAMRRILVDEARRRRAEKRGGPHARKLSFETSHLITDSEPDHLELHDALSRLENQEPRAGQVVELRFFGGMTMPEVADLLDVSLRTVEKDWAFARAWLRRELSRSSD